MKTGRYCFSHNYILLVSILVIQAMKVNVEGIDCWNFATQNYLGLVGREDIEDEAVNCIRQYGVGSCGPR